MSAFLKVPINRYYSYLKHTVYIYIFPIIFRFSFEHTHILCCVGSPPKEMVTSLSFSLSLELWLRIEAAACGGIHLSNVPRGVSEREKKTAAWKGKESTKIFSAEKGLPDAISVN